MIHYPITLKSLKKENQKPLEEEIIATEEGEVLGRKGGVAKLTQIFKVDTEPSVKRSHSLGRYNSRIPTRKASAGVTLNGGFHQSRIPKLDIQKLDNESESFSDKQAKVEDLLKLYNNNNSVSKTESSRKSNFKTKPKNENPANYKNRFQDHIPGIRELRKREEFKITRDKEGAADLFYRQRYSDKRASLINNELHVSHNDGVISKSKWDDYDDKEVPNIKTINNSDSFNSKCYESNPKTDDEEKELIETWEEIHTIPYTKESEIFTAGNSNGQDNNSRSDVSFQIPTSSYHQSQSGIFPDKESAYKHLVSLRQTSNKSADSEEKKNSFNYQRKSLAEILSEYQQKGIVPSKEIPQTDFPVKRSEFFIENNIDTTSAARTIDIVPQCTPTVGNNANPYQNSFYIAKENPLYTNNSDWQDSIGKNKWRLN